MTSPERDAFEKHYAGYPMGRCKDAYCRDEGDDHYDTDATQARWEGWQARAALVAPQGGEPVAPFVWAIMPNTENRISTFAYEEEAVRKIAANWNEPWPLGSCFTDLKPYRVVPLYLAPVAPPAPGTGDAKAAGDPVERAFRGSPDELRAKSRLFLSLPDVLQHKVAQAVLQNLLPYVSAESAVDRGIVLFKYANENGRLHDLFDAINRQVAAFTSNA